MILGDDNAVLMSLITKKNVYWEIMEANIYIISPPKSIEFPQHLMVKMFYEMILMSPFYCENNFFLPVLKLRIFGGYLFVKGASM